MKLVTLRILSGLRTTKALMRDFKKNDDHQHSIILRSKPTLKVNIFCNKSTSYFKSGWTVKKVVNEFKLKAQNLKWVRYPCTSSSIFSVFKKKICLCRVCAFLAKKVNLT